MLKGYKTIAFNAIMGLILLVRAVSPETDLPGEQEVSSTLDNLLSHLDEIIAIGGNIWLRFVTTSAVFNKGAA